MDVAVIADIGKVAGAVAASTGVLAGGWKYALSPAIRFSRKLNAMVTNWQPNGGSSHADKLHQIAAAVERIEHRESLGEQRQRLLLNLSDVPYIEIDAVGMCSYSNKAWRTLTSLTPAESTGNGWMLAAAPAERERVAKEVASAMTEGRPVTIVFRRVVRRGRSPVMCMEFEPIRNSDGTVIGYYGTAESVSPGTKAA